MKRRAAAVGTVLLALALAGCQVAETPQQPTRVLIRSGDEVVTTYQLSDDGRVLESTTNDEYGAPISRSYSYGSGKQLESVARHNLATQEVTLFTMTPEVPSGSKGLSKSTVTVAGPRGLTSQTDVEYHYGEDGRLAGIVRKDAYGNVQAKDGGKGGGNR